MRGESRGTAKHVSLCYTAMKIQTGGSRNGDAEKEKEGEKKGKWAITMVEQRGGDEKARKHARNRVGGDQSEKDGE